jgi:hypothetical protein
MVTSRRARRAADRAGMGVTRELAGSYSMHRFAAGLPPASSQCLKLWPARFRCGTGLRGACRRPRCHAAFPRAARRIRETTVHRVTAELDPVAIIAIRNSDAAA